MPDEDDQIDQRRKAGVAVVIPACNEEERIAATVRACKAIPGVDLIVVVDDGSEDQTQTVARQAGAATVRHTINRGKASAMETGANIVAMHDTADKPPRILLFLDADLEETAAASAPLVEAVVSGRADCSIAVLPPAKGAGGHGFVLNLSRKAIQRATGWVPRAPLSGQRCMTREAFRAATPLATGWGVETAMTIQLLIAGFTLIEVPCQIGHRVTRSDLRGQLHRLHQYMDVNKAVYQLRLKRARAPRNKFRVAAEHQKPFEPYSIAK